MENTYASKHFFFNKKYLSYNQNLTAICSGYNLPAGYAKISVAGWKVISGTNSCKVLIVR